VSLTEEIVDDQRIKEDDEKMQKIHSLIEKLFPDKEVLIDCFNDEIKWEVRDKLEINKSKKKKLE
jgi:hypothetical protein